MTIETGSKSQNSMRASYVIGPQEEMVRHRECVRFIFAARFAVEMKNPGRRGIHVDVAATSFSGFFLTFETANQ